VKPNAYQMRVIQRARDLLADPQAVIPDSYPADDHRGRDSFLIGWMKSQMESLLHVAEELAGLSEDEGDES